MEKMLAFRSIYRAACLRSSRFSATAAVTAAATHHHHHLVSRSFFTFSSPSASSPSRNLPSDGRSPFAVTMGSVHYFSEDVSHMPAIIDPEIHNAFKDLMANNWDELPQTAVHDAKKALSKNTDDKTGQEVLANVFRAAEAVEEFTGILVSLKMEIDDSIGLSGENVKDLPDDIEKALKTVYQRYTTYLDSFGPDEAYLRKKVEVELGTGMIHLKMRCSGLESDWGKVSVLGTSGLSGSYVEQRA